MHRQFLISVWLAIFFACASLAAPIPNPPPLGTDTDPAEPENKIQQDNKDRIDRANQIVNTQIVKMAHAIKNKDDPNNKKLINAAFGSDTQHDINKITENVQKLKLENVPVKLDTAGGNTLAFTRYDDSVNPMIKQQIEFGKQFHAPKNTDDNRAGTLIHESTHYLGNTGDVIDATGKMIPGDIKIEDPKLKRTGYATGKEPKTTPEQLDNDKNWKNMRDGYTTQGGETFPPTTDLHNNAESYTQFGSIANHAITDHDAGIGLAQNKRPVSGSKDQNKATVPEAAPLPRKKVTVVKKGGAEKEAGEKAGIPQPPPPPPKKGTPAKKDATKNSAAKKGAASKSNAPPPSEPAQDGPPNKKPKSGIPNPPPPPPPPPAASKKGAAKNAPAPKAP